MKPKTKQKTIKFCQEYDIELLLHELYKECPEVEIIEILKELRAEEADVK